MSVLNARSGLCTNEILDHMGLPAKGNKPVLNKLLYAMVSSGKVKRIESTPPRWHSTSKRAKTSGENKGKREPKTIVLIDVDNSPCLKQAEPYAKESVYVYAYASPAYNHYHPQSTRNLVYQKLSENYPSAADVLFCMKMTEICMTEASPKENLEFVIVSKDKILATMAAMHKQKYGVAYTMVTNSWVGLRHHLE